MHSFRLLSTRTSLLVTFFFATSLLNAQESETGEQKNQDKQISGQLQVTGGKSLDFSSLEELDAIVKRLQKKIHEAKSNTPNYVEMTTNDLVKSKEFYKSAFGFSFVDYGKQYAAVPSGPIAIGFAESKELSAPMLAIQTVDIEASFEKVKSANGQIKKEIFRFPGGQRFEFLDPSGNRVAVFQNN